MRRFLLFFFLTGNAAVISQIAGLANYKDQRKISGEAEWQLRAAGRRRGGGSQDEVGNQRVKA